MPAAKSRKPASKKPAEASPSKADDSMKSILTGLKQRYPGREAQIDHLAELFKANSSKSNLLFVYGPPGSAKTSVVQDLLSGLEIGHAYVSCSASIRTRTVLGTILKNITGGKRTRENDYDLPSRCDTLTDFMNTLPSAIARHKGMVWIVVDEAQRLASSDLLTALTRAPDQTGAKVGILIISTQPWGTGKFSKDNQNVHPHTSIHFPGYSQDQLLKIIPKLASVPANDPLIAAYRQFLQALVPAIARASSNVLDVHNASERLWPKYSAPLREGKALQGPALMARIRTDVQHMISELEMGGTAETEGTTITTDTGTAQLQLQPDGTAELRAVSGAASGAVDRRACAQGLPYELPYMSKFILLAAYIASRNKATADRAVFDPGYSHRGRRNSQALDRQAEAAIEAVHKGPHSFPLERLLHIFYCIYDQHDPEGDEETEGAGAPRRHEVQRAEVLMQITTLVKLHLLSGSGSDMLDGGSYRCNLHDDVALAIAANVKLRLGDYLKLA